MSKNLTLYIRNFCPFCDKVTDFMDTNNINIEIKNIFDSKDIFDELMSIGGKTQSPCLVIDGQAMYESDDIITWLAEHFNVRSN